MTVHELIQELLKIPNQNANVCFVNLVAEFDLKEVAMHKSNAYLLWKFKDGWCSNDK